MKVNELPVGSAPPSLEYPHFPTRYQAVIWRNWNMVSPERLAATLETDTRTIEKAAGILGLVRNDTNLENGPNGVS